MALITLRDYYIRQKYHEIRILQYVRIKISRFSINFVFISRFNFEYIASRFRIRRLSVKNPVRTSNRLGNRVLASTTIDYSDSYAADTLRFSHGKTPSSETLNEKQVIDSSHNDDNLILCLHTNMVFVQTS